MRKRSKIKLIDNFHPRNRHFREFTAQFRHPQEKIFKDAGIYSGGYFAPLMVDLYSVCAYNESTNPDYTTIRFDSDMSGWTIDIKYNKFKKIMQELYAETANTP